MTIRDSANDEEYVSLTYKSNDYHVPLHFIMNEHPAGPGYILEYANADMKEAFIDAGHSQDAEDMLAQWAVNKNNENDHNNENKTDDCNKSMTNDKGKSKNSIMSAIISTQQNKHTTQLMILTLGVITTAALFAFATHKIRQST